MSKTGCIISHEGIEYLCGLIRDINGLDTNLIDDLNIKSNGTFSSVRINTLLNALKTDCNDYTFSLVSNLSRLELKVVTDEADMVEHNKLYLIKKAGETSYSQYVIVTNDTGVDEKILLGTCDISMTDYLKITDADSTYCKKTDLNTTNNVLSNHINDTDIHVSTTDKEKWDKVTDKVDKTDIVTTIDETSTEKQIPSAVAFYNECQGKPISINDINTYGTEILKYPVGRWRTNTHKTASLFSDLPVPSAFFIDIFSLNNEKNANPWNASWAYNFYVFYPLGANGCYIRSIQSGKSAGEIDYDSGWQKLCTTSVKDVPWTTISESTFTNTTFVPGGTCSYSIKNGMCHIRLNGLTTSAGAYITAPNGTFPNPEIKITNGHYPAVTSSGNCVMCIISSSGGLTIRVPSSIGDIYTTLSYPVAES